MSMIHDASPDRRRWQLAVSVSVCLVCSAYLIVDLFGVARLSRQPSLLSIDSFVHSLFIDYEMGFGSPGIGATVYKPTP